MQNSGRIVLALVGAFLLVIIIYANLDQKTPSHPSERTKVFSKLVGYKIWNELKNAQDYYVLEDIIEGMKECQAGKLPPKELDSEEEQEFSSEIEEEIIESTSKRNLAIAEQYLRDISTNPQMVELEKGKLYYEVVQEGNGAEIVFDDAYTFHYTIMTHDLEVVQDTRKSNSPKTISLPDAMVGFSRGCVGMKCGERRKLYIHPDLAYRQASWRLPAQSILIIDVELLASQ